MDKYFFKKLKEEKLKNFKIPIFLQNFKNRTKYQYIFKNIFEIDIFDKNLFVTDKTFKRIIEKNNFISFNYKNFRKKENKFHIKIEYINNNFDEIICNSNDNILFYNNPNEYLYILLNYNIIKEIPLENIKKITIDGIKSEIIEIDYIKDYAEYFDPNLFNITESLLKSTNDNFDDFQTFNDYNYLYYTLNYKKSEIEKYISFNKPELINEFMNFKGSYKDLELIKKINLFEKILFKDENNKYTNFINYFINILPENYEFAIKTFIKNYNLYQKFKENFKCFIKPENDYYLVDWDKLKIGSCNFIVKDKPIEGIYFVNDIIDNKIKFSVNITKLNNLQKRYIEIINDVKSYVETIKKIRSEDFSQIKMVIDNNPKIKIINNELLLIPGQEINISDIKLDGSLKECYLDYAIKLNLDDNLKIKKFNENLKSLKIMLKERMPFLLRTYFEYLDGYMKSVYDFNKNLNEDFEIDYDLEIKDIYDTEKKLNEIIEENYYFEPIEEFDKLEEEFGFRVERENVNPYGIKICGTGIIDENNFKTMGYQYNKLKLKGPTKEDVYYYNNIKVGRYCISNDDKKVLDVYVSKENIFSDKYKRKDLVKCRIDDLYEKYKNNVIEITNKYFDYVKNTENIFDFSELNNLNLKTGIYTIKNKYIEIDNNYLKSNIKIIGTGIIYNNNAYIIDLKDQIFKGKPNNKLIAREYVIVYDGKNKNNIEELNYFDKGVYKIKNIYTKINNYFENNWEIIGKRIIENNQTYIINVPFDTNYSELINAREYFLKIK